MKKLGFLLVGFLFLSLGKSVIFADFMFTDDFNRANGPLSGGWIVGTAPATISGNKMNILAISSYTNAIAKYPTAHINQTITFDFQMGSGSDLMQMGLRQTSNPGQSQSAYYVNLNINDNTAILRKVLSGATSNAGSGSINSRTFAYLSGHTYQATFSASGTSPTLLTLSVRDLDTDTDAIVPISLEDDTPSLQNAGGVGLWSYRISAGTGNVYVDNFIYSSNDEEMNDYIIQSSDLWNNGYNNSGDVPRQSPLSRFIFATSAPTIQLTTQSFGSPSNYLKVGISVNGEAKPALSAVAGTQVFTINLGEANITKTVELTSSPHAASSAITPPTTMSYLNSIQYSSAYDFEVLSPTVSNERILIYGDSISQGSRAINIMTEGYIPLLRNTYQFEDVMSEGRGYRSLYDDAFTEQQRNDFVQRLASYAPATLYLAMGTNDNGILSTWGGINNFQTAYEDFLVKLHIALPNARIIVQPLLAGLNTNSASQAIKNASTGKNYITLIDPSSWLASGAPDFDDGNTHPTTSGYIKYANRLAPLLSNSGFNISGPNSGEVSMESETFTATLARGATFVGDQTITITVATGTISATAGTVNNNATSSVQITPANGTTGFTFTYTSSSATGDVEITFTNEQQWINPDAILFNVHLSNTGGIVPSNPNTPSGGGGGGSSASKDNCPNGDFSASYYDGTCGTPNEQETTTGNNTENPASNDKVGTGLVPVRDEGEAEGVVNQEILTAYQFAYAHNITTLAPITNANPDGTVIRGHLAKMVVNYALNVLGKTLPAKVPAECHRKDGSNAWESFEIKDYAVKACSLGLMGIDMDYFQPYAQVSRAQFGTVLSRLLYGNEYAGGKPYYAKHLQALKENGIMTQLDDPEARMELRQWVRLMLMRSAK